MSDQSNDSLIIVGAGLSGLYAGSLLREHFNVSIFEKSNGILGRISSRRFDQDEILKGILKFDLTSQEFSKFLQLNIDRSFKLNQENTLCSLHRNQFKKHFTGLNIIRAHQVIAIKENENLVEMTVLDKLSDQEKIVSTKRLILSGPLPQMLDLVDEEEIPKLSSVQYSQQLVLISKNLSDFEILSQSKEFTLVKKIGTHGVFHLNEDQPSFSNKNEAIDFLAWRFDLPKNEFEESRWHIHFWKYANCLNPLSEPFYKLKDNIYLIGDAFAGGGLQGAWTSGLQIANFFMESTND